jgi:hypothetical protein
MAAVVVAGHIHRHRISFCVLLHRFASYGANNSFKPTPLRGAA